MTVQRAEPAFDLPERDMLRGWLDYHRATLEWKCEGLTDEQLRQSVVAPSNLTLLGLVRHMGEVERWWFGVVFDGQDDVEIYPDFSEWRDLDKADIAADFAFWRKECDAARAIEQKAASLDDLGQEVVDGDPQSPYDVSLRWVMTHMIEEYARHNGHADLIRERIDGQTGD